MTRRLLVTVCLAGVAVAAAAGAFGAVSVLHSGREATARTTIAPYVIYRPAGVSRDQLAPLVVVGTGPNPQDLVSLTGFNAVADRGKFVVAYVSFSKTYNDQARLENGSGEPYPDLPLLRSTVLAIRDREHIDPTRIYLTGFSATGVLSFRAACVLGGIFAAVAPVGGRLVEPDCVPPAPISLFVVYGATDPSLTTPLIRGNVDHWRAVDGCPANAATTTSGAATIETWSGCRGGTTVALATIAGQDHGWPVAPRFGASDALWTFFSSQRLASTSLPADALLSVLAQKTAHGRQVLVRVKVYARATVALKLIRGTAVKASRSWIVAAGTRTLKLPVPSTAPAGRYKLVVMFRRAAGPATSATRLVTLKG